MDLIQRCQAGDKAGWVTLFHRYRNLVYKTAYLLLGDVQSAEDAQQEVFIKAYHSLKTFTPKKGAFTTWLRRITVNHCLNVHRQERRKSLSLENLAGKRSPPAETRHSLLPEEQALNQERVEIVWQAIQYLSPPLRTVVVLRYYQDLLYREIAEILDIPLGTVKWRLHKAIETLRPALEEAVERDVLSLSKGR